MGDPPAQTLLTARAMSDDDRSTEPPERVPRPAHPSPPSHPPSPSHLRAELSESRRRAADAAGPAPPTPAPLVAPGRWAGTVFTTAFVVAVVLCWPALEAKQSLPDALYGLPIALVVATALLDALISRRPFRRALWLATAVLPAAVLARVVVDGLRDGPSHAMWLIEIATAFGVGLPAALAGAALGGLALRLLDRGRTRAG